MQQMGNSHFTSTKFGGRFRQNDSSKPWSIRNSQNRSREQRRAVFSSIQKENNLSAQFRIKNKGKFEDLGAENDNAAKRRIAHKKSLNVRTRERIPPPEKKPRKTRRFSKRSFCWMEPDSVLNDLVTLANLLSPGRDKIMDAWFKTYPSHQYPPLKDDPIPEGKEDPFDQSILNPILVEQERQRQARLQKKPFSFQDMPLPKRYRHEESYNIGDIPYKDLPRPESSQSIPFDDRMKFMKTRPTVPPRKPQTFPDNIIELEPNYGIAKQGNSVPRLTDMVFAKPAPREPRVLRDWSGTSWGTNLQNNNKPDGSKK